MIDCELFKKHGDLGRFRHVFRTVYSFELDWEKMKFVAKLFDEIYRSFIQAITGFLDKMEKAIAES